jgi:hypothetical protein
LPEKKDGGNEMDFWLYITIIVAFSLLYFGYENKKKYELKAKEIELEQKYLELEMKKIEKGIQTRKQNLDE